MLSLSLGNGADWWMDWLPHKYFVDVQIFADLIFQSGLHEVRLQQEWREKGLITSRFSSQVMFIL